MCLVELRHQEDLDQQQGHVHEPVHVRVGIADGDPGLGRVVDVPPAVLVHVSGVVRVRATPGVEGPDVMARRNGGHQTQKMRTTLLGHLVPTLAEGLDRVDSLR